MTLVNGVAKATAAHGHWNTVDVADRFESAYGYKQTSSRPKSTSALHPASDILDRVGNDRL